MSLVTEEIRAKAEVYYGEEICQQKTKYFLKEAGLPNGLLPLKDIEECGYVKETGFVWLKQKNKIEHKFEKIGKVTSYANNVTAYVEPKKIRKLTGVKVKELLLWITLTNIYVNDPPSDDKITFKSSAGICKTFPVSAFQIEEKYDQGTATATATATIEQGKVVEI
ncbi:hypothetical protein NE237_015393 [Protea cynaroides]|uniref:Uncharacterized protein n=1 Tax=Protea cynaroides TaxID=273540 RepID=A0A9Q0KDX6_9MAGN|nr:hypothetical protein NE237_015393 [Protea cynaroides]